MSRSVLNWPLLVHLSDGEAAGLRIVVWADVPGKRARRRVLKLLRRNAHFEQSLNLQGRVQSDGIVGVAPERQLVSGAL